VGASVYYGAEFNMSSILLQIVIQEKGSDDYRSFAIVKHPNGDRWELRGYGSTPGKAADHVYDRFEQEPEQWEFYGHPIPSPAETAGS
jgi:hypothetical protein